MTCVNTLAATATSSISLAGSRSFEPTIDDPTTRLEFSMAGHHMMKDQLFLGTRATAKLKRKRLGPKPTWSDGPLDPIPGGGTVRVRLRDGREGIMPMTYDALQKKAIYMMERHDELNRSRERRLLYEQSLDRNYKER